MQKYKSNIFLPFFCEQVETKANVLGRFFLQCNKGILSLPVLFFLQIDDNSNRLLPFLLFARMFPISPSWLLNIVAPFLNIPLPIFAFSAFIGQLLLV